MYPCGKINSKYNLNFNFMFLWDEKAIKKHECLHSMKRRPKKKSEITLFWPILLELKTKNRR